METPPNAPYIPYVPPAAPPKSKTPVILIALLGSCGCALLMIPILAAILFPVFAQAREKARQTSCLSNERQMALGVLMYVQDYDETYPVAPEWMTQIKPYIKNSAVYACPSAVNHAQAETGSVFTYAYNSQMSKRETSADESARNDSTALQLVGNDGECLRRADQSARSRSAHGA